MEAKLWTTSPSDTLPIKIGNQYPANLEPETVPAAMLRTAEKMGDQVAHRVEMGGKWHTITWKQYSTDVSRFAKALIAQGVDPHEGVTIQGTNSPEWLIANVGAIFARTIPAGVYTTNSAETSRYIARHCNARVIVVEDDTQLDKYLENEQELSAVKCFVVWKSATKKFHSSKKPIYTFEKFLKLGDAVDDQDLQDRLKGQKAGECASLVYTSGTTGKPKAVMLSHDNILWTAKMSADAYRLGKRDQVVSYLPLSHIAAQQIDCFFPIQNGYTVTFARPDALKGSLSNTLKQVRPTIFLGVPRVWEKIEEKMREVGAGATGVKKVIATWAKAVGLKKGQRRQKGRQLLPHLADGMNELFYTTARQLAFKKVRKALGFDRCRILGSASAPLPIDTQKYFMSLDMLPLDIYGMSETAGLGTLSLPNQYRLGSCGRAQKGIELRLKDKDEQDAGEIQLRGRNIFMGYLHDEEATRKVFDNEGFMSTGDVGKVDSKGYLSITGRSKELIITAGGENIAPVPIEQNLKRELPFLSQAVVVGDRRKYLIALASLKTELDKEGNPIEKLTAEVIKVFHKAGSRATTLQEARDCPIVAKLLNEGLQKVNLQAISRAAKVQKICLLPDDLSVAAGTLTHTMKLKRPFINERYHDIIEKS